MFFGGSANAAAGRKQPRITHSACGTARPSGTSPSTLTISVIGDRHKGHFNARSAGLLRRRDTSPDFHDASKSLAQCWQQ